LNYLQAILNNNYANTTSSTMPPLTLPYPYIPSSSISSTHTILQKRDSSCTYSDASCSTHRLAILIIIICVGIIVSAILSLLYVRSRRSKAAKMRANMQHRMKANKWQASSDIGRAYGTPAMEGAPPPYEPRRPERVARVEEWR
jgi:hypothetical protein